MQKKNQILSAPKTTTSITEIMQPRAWKKHFYEWYYMKKWRVGTLNFKNTYDLLKHKAK